MNTRCFIGMMFSVFCAIGLIGCISEDEQTDKVEEINAEVSAITSISCIFFTNDPIEGMLVRLENDKDFSFLSFNEIEGFSYQRGNEYHLRIEKRTLANPPADGSNCRFRLIEILSQKQGVGTKEKILLSVSSEIGNYKWGDITQDIPSHGMKIKEGTSNEWVVVPFNKIDGFDYEMGYDYELSVEKITLPINQDESNWQTTQYVLIDIISKKKS